MFSQRKKYGAVQNEGFCTSFLNLHVVRPLKRLTRFSIFADSGFHICILDITMFEPLSH